MEFRTFRSLRGPNRWGSVAVLEATLSLGQWEEVSASQLRTLAERLVTPLTTLGRPTFESAAGLQVQNALLARLREATRPVELVAYVAALFARNVGTAAGFCEVGATADPKWQQFALSCDPEGIARACCETARQLCLAALLDHPLDVQAARRQLRELADDICLGPSSQTIVSAAIARDIPVRRLNIDSLIQLGHGIQQRRICTAQSDSTSAVAQAIAGDKELTKTVLRAVGVPVPDGRAAHDAAEAWAIAEEIGLPVVVKPRAANHGRGVFTNLLTREQVERSFELAQREGEGVLVEQYAPGLEHRFLVVGGQLVAAARGEPAQVVGDGAHTIRELIDSQLNSDPRRTNFCTTPLAVVQIEGRVCLALEQQGYQPDSVPPVGAVVKILGIGNHDRDVTDQVHPDVATRAIDAAKAVGLDIAGIDAVLEDVTRPLEQQGGMIVEVNAGPSLLMHLEPSKGEPRAVGEAIVGALFPNGQTGRIPIVAVSGDDRAAHLVRLLSRLLATQHKLVGAAGRMGTFVGDRCIVTADRRSVRGADDVLFNPWVDAAVFEVSPKSILDEGLGFDRADVVVLYPGEADASGTPGNSQGNEAREATAVLLRSLADHGAVVLDADDPRAADLIQSGPTEVVLFSQDADSSFLRQHLDQSGRATFVRGGQIVVRDRDRELLLEPARLAVAWGCESLLPSLSDLLPVVAAAVGLGMQLDASIEPPPAVTTAPVQPLAVPRASRLA